MEKSTICLAREFPETPRLMVPNQPLAPEFCDTCLMTLTGCIYIVVFCIIRRETVYLQKYHLAIVTA